MKDINYLEPKGKISLVAPSFGCTTEPYKTRLEIAIKNLEKDGFTVLEGQNIYLAKAKARSNSPKECAKEFNRAYLDDDSSAIISVGGGELMDEILPFIDFENIKKAPHKFFMGFSDNTNLTFTLTTICEAPAIYGPCATSFAYKPYIYSARDSLDLLMGKKTKVEGYPVWERYPSQDDEDPLAVSNFTEKKELKIFPNNNVKIKGRLIGGCLDCLVNLCGTRFDNVRDYIEKYKDDGFIWFLEACDLSPISIQRALFQLGQAGWFKYVRGFIFGRPLCYKKRVFGINHYNAIKAETKSYKVPVIMDADLGHFNPSMPIVTGVIATVEADSDNNFIIQY